MAATDAFFFCGEFVKKGLKMAIFAVFSLNMAKYDSGFKGGGLNQSQNAENFRRFFQSHNASKVNGFNTNQVSSKSM